MSGAVFDFVGGALCLDFTNTVNHPPKAPIEETLQDYGDLLAWSLQAGQLRESEAEELRHTAAREPEAAAAVLGRARALREAVYSVFLAVARDAAPPADDLGVLNVELARGLPHRRLCRGRDGFCWNWESGAELDRVLWPVATSAAELLTSGDCIRVGQCDGDRCAYLFVDCTKNRRRRWCDMRVCGNRAKVRRHRRRRTTAGGGQ